LERIVSLRVDERIAALLTPQSFEAVRGRTQIAVFCARKSGAGDEASESRNG
jgi:hypothetical protein